MSVYLFEKHKNLRKRRRADFWLNCLQAKACWAHYWLTQKTGLARRSPLVVWSKGKDVYSDGELCYGIYDHKIQTIKLARCMLQYPYAAAGTVVIHEAIHAFCRDGHGPQFLKLEKWLLRKQGVIPQYGRDDKPYYFRWVSYRKKGRGRK